MTTIDTYYTVARVRALLRLYPYLLDAHPPEDPELAGMSRRLFGPNGWRDEAACKRADIWRAIVWLEERSPQAAYVIRANVAVGLPLRAAQSYVERHWHREVSHETVRRWREDGLILMSDYLSGKSH